LGFHFAEFVFERPGRPGTTSPQSADHSVPYEFSKTLDQEITQAGKTVEFYGYPGDDHNIANSFGIAMQRSIQFFDKYVKQPQG